MNILKILLISVLLFDVGAYSTTNKSYISRKNLLNIASICVANKLLYNPKLALAINEDNPPLTPEQMEEYKKLLKDAERIKIIISANKDALINDENGVKKYLEEKGIPFNQYNISKN